jgi:dTDP-4-dehydrorhamnose reductase
MTKRLLITGCNGFLGWNLWRQLDSETQSHWQLHGLGRTSPDTADGLSYHPFDLAEHKTLSPLFARINPDAVIHLAALSSPNDCEQSPAYARCINVEASETIARLCAKKSIPLVFASSSQVYAGDKPPYDEASETLPGNAYGQQKLDAEEAIFACYPQASICRLPLMYGQVPASGETFLQTVVRACLQQQTLPLFTDEYRMFLGAQSAAAGLQIALKQPGQRLVLAGDERLSRYDFGLRVAKHYGLDSQYLKPCKQADIPMAAKRPGDLLLLNKKAKSLGFSPLTLEQELAAIPLASLTEQLLPSRQE